MMNHCYRVCVLTLALLTGCATVSPLDEAISHGDLARVETLLAQGSPADNADALSGSTPLIDAAFWGHTDIVKTLLAHGANPRAKNAGGSSALDMAISSQCSGCALALIETGIDVNYVDPTGYTPLGKAVLFGELSVFQSLLQHGARLDLEPDFGCSYLGLAASMSPLATKNAQQAAMDGVQIAQILLDAGQKVDWEGSNAKKGTPLMRAAGVGYAEMVKFLIAHGADVERVAVDGSTARSLAQQFHPEILAVIDQAVVDRANQKQKLKQDALNQRIAAQTCQQKEKNWFFLGGHCQQGIADGVGEAESADQTVRFKGKFRQGYFSRGEFTSRQGDQWHLLYSGPVQNSRWHGEGICGDNKEPCTWQQGQRVDAAYLTRVANQVAEQEALRRQEQAQAELMNLRIEQQEEEDRLAEVAQCLRQAEQERDEDTIASCDEQGNIHVEQKSDEIMARQQAMYQAFVNASDALVATAQQQASTTTYASSGSTAVNQGDANARLNQLNQQLREAEQRLQVAQQSVVQVQQPMTSPSTVTAPMPPATGNGQTAQWDSAMPEALAVCWHNEKNYWFCDGPLQVTLVGEKDIQAVRKLVGCRTDDSELRELGSSGQYRIYGCGRGLQQGERDMRSLYGVSGGNQYRCLKKENDAGHLCRQLSAQ